MDRSLGGRNEVHAMVPRVIPDGQIGVVIRLRRVSLGTLGLVRGGLMVAGPVRFLRRPMMPRGALVMVRGLAVMIYWAVRHFDLPDLPVACELVRVHADTFEVETEVETGKTPTCSGYTHDRVRAAAWE